MAVELDTNGNGAIDIEKGGTNATTVSGANIKIGDQVAFRLYRNPTDAQDTYPDDACVITFGIHSQIDTLGSRNITPK